MASMVCKMAVEEMVADVAATLVAFLDVYCCSDGPNFAVGRVMDLAVVDMIVDCVVMLVVISVEEIVLLVVNGSVKVPSFFNVGHDPHSVVLCNAAVCKHVLEEGICDINTNNRIQCVPMYSKRKPIIQVNFSENWNDLSEKVYIVTKFSLSFLLTPVTRCIGHARPSTNHYKWWCQNWFAQNRNLRA